MAALGVPMPDWALTIALLAALAAYLFVLVPRLSAAAAVAITCVLASVLIAMALWQSPLASALMPVLAALVAGHGGWAFGRRTNVPVAAVVTPVPRPVPSATPRVSPPARQPEPVKAPPAATASTPGRPTASALDRQTLGRYRLERELGRGAMGSVYLGRDPQIGRAVAIKTMALGSEFEGAELAEARQRFFREAETAGRLQHADIVTIFDAGEDRDLAYIAMEYLKGHDLQRHTAPAKLLPVPTVLRIVARVALALGYAHSQGVVHRDIKPANVMIDLQDDTVKVTDFGIARITDSSRTRTGMVLGTPSFMSPEQMAGQRVDGRADLYSLGVMLFQLLTGQLPHKAESMAKLMYSIANEPAPDVRSLRADLPEALARIVAGMLEKRPAARLADGPRIAAELTALAAAVEPLAPAATAAPAGTPPVVDPFEATVIFSRPEPRHNSGD